MKITHPTLKQDIKTFTTVRPTYLSTSNGYGFGGYPQYTITVNNSIYHYEKEAAREADFKSIEGLMLLHNYCPILSAAGAKEYIKSLYNHGLNFHPDTRADEYINEEGEQLINPDCSHIFDNNIEDCFSFLGQSIYSYSLKCINEVTGTKYNRYYFNRCCTQFEHSNYEKAKRLFLAMPTEARQEMLKEMQETKYYNAYEFFSSIPK